MEERDQYESSAVESLGNTGAGGTGDPDVSSGASPAETMPESDGKKSERTVALPLLTLVMGALIAALIGATVTYFLTRSVPSQKQVATADRLKGYVVDDFSIDSEAGGLVNTANGRPWSGSPKNFMTSDGQLGLADTDVKGAQVLLVDTGAPNHVVAATFPVVESGCGVVFRYKGPNNYWSLTAAEAAGTWTLTKVVNGEKESPVLLGSAPTADGTQVMIRTEGNRLFFYFDGVLYNTFNDGDNADATRVGFIFAGNGAPKVRADEFVALPARQRVGGAVNGGGETPTTAPNPDDGTDDGEAAPTTAKGTSDGAAAVTTAKVASTATSTTTK